MSSDKVAISVQGISKMYQIYARPGDRLKQIIVPRLKRMMFIDSVDYFEYFWALQDVSFEVKKGHTVGIIGRNGSGKSTLLQLVCGTLSPTFGQVEVNGRVAALLELGAGFNTEFTGRENVYLNAALLGLGQRETDDRYQSIVDFADIGQFIDQPVKSYSSGMVVRLAFAIAINVDATVLVIDEALAVGDELFQRKCFAKLESLKESGVTILFVSHSASAVVELCDQAMLLEDGKRLAMGEPKYIVGQYQKMLFASDELRESLKSELCEKDRLDRSRTSEDTKEQDSASSVEDFFDPALHPESTIEYESRGAVIENLRITTLAGKQVNHLVRGRRYVYCYDVRFTCETKFIQFGMLIKTTSGVALGGYHSSTTGKTGIAKAETGEIITAKFEFRCALNSGIYYLNAGVVGTVDGEERHIHRLLDGCCFRVIDEPELLAQGKVDFDISYRL